MRSDRHCGFRGVFECFKSRGKVRCEAPHFANPSEPWLKNLQVPKAQGLREGVRLSLSVN